MPSGSAQTCLLVPQGLRSAILGTVAQCQGVTFHHSVSPSCSPLQMAPESVLSPWRGQRHAASCSFFSMVLLGLMPGAATTESLPRHGSQGWTGGQEASASACLPYMVSPRGSWEGSRAPTPRRDQDSVIWFVGPRGELPPLRPGLACLWARMFESGCSVPGFSASTRLLLRRQVAAQVIGFLPAHWTPTLTC